MSTKYDVSVVVINYNSKKYIDNLFESLVRLKHSDFTFQVVVVDNASSDDSVEYLESRHFDRDIDLKIVKSETNRGFAGGNNFGVQHSDGEYIVFLNNDTAVDEMWLETLYHFIRDSKNCVMANSKLLFFYDYVTFSFRTADKIELDRNIITVKLPLLDKSGAHTFVFDVKKWNADTDAVIVGGKEYKADKDGKITVELTDSEVEQLRVTLVQNAGSGIDSVYNGYDIGFCKPDGEEYSKPYELSNGCGASIIMKKKDFFYFRFQTICQ